MNKKSELYTIIIINIDILHFFYLIFCAVSYAHLMSVRHSFFLTLRNRGPPQFFQLKTLKGEQRWIKYQKEENLKIIRIL